MRVAKEYLDGELAKCETWNDSHKFMRVLFDRSDGFLNAKKQGVGQVTILKFLGMRVGKSGNRLIDLLTYF